MVTHSNQPHLFEVLFKSMDAANSSCSFKKQDLTSKKVKFLQLVFVFIDFYRLYLEITLFCTKPSGKIIQFQVADVKMLRFFVYCIRTLSVFDFSLDRFCSESHRKNGADCTEFAEFIHAFR